jgi:glucokinase
LTGEYAIGIDLGATTLRLGAFLPNGELLADQQTGIRAEQGPEAGVERILEGCASLITQVSGQGMPASGLLGIGIGSTGPTDSIRGRLLNPLTMPGWLDVPLVEPLESRFSVPACLENDAAAAALGEYWQGAGRVASDDPDEPESQPVSRLYAVTVGTGIGTAFICDGQVYRGADGYHPEGGHLIVDPSGPRCYCGANGCWESLSSGSAIAHHAREALETAPPGLETPGALLLSLAGGDPGRVTAEIVCQAARQGDPLAVQVIERAAQAFALGLHSILMLFYPDLVVLSGGVMRSLDLFLPAIERVIASADGYIPASRVRIQPARLGYYAGIYGAAYAILQKVAKLPPYPLTALIE